MFGRLIAVAAALGLTSCVTMPSSQGKADDQADILAFAGQCKPWDDWEKPADPFRIHGSTYYVGTCGISAILIVGDEGHMLIDTGTSTGVEVVVRNISKLGIELTEIKSILYSHEHYDHMGGHAYMQSLTGSQVLVGPKAASQILRGKTAQDDPQYGIHPDTRPIPDEAASLLVRADGDGRPFIVATGPIELTMHRTPGHTPGALSWQWSSCEPNVGCKTIVYADSMSPVSADDYRFSDHPAYVAEYRAGIARLAALDCDILLTPHPSASFMLERAATGTMEGGMTCQEYAEAVTRRLDARLEREAGANQ